MRLPDWSRITLEVVALFVLVMTLILVPVLISASQIDQPHRQYPLKAKAKP